MSGKTNGGVYVPNLVPYSHGGVFYFADFDAGGTFFTVEPLRNFAWNGADDLLNASYDAESLTIAMPGLYLVHFEAIIAGTGAAQTMKVALTADGQPLLGGRVDKSSGAAHPPPISLSVIRRFSANTTLAAANVGFAPIRELNAHLTVTQLTEFAADSFTYSAMPPISD
jgi:hypothetical protein